MWGLAAVLQTSRKAAREGLPGLQSGAASGMYLLSDSDDEDLEGMIADDEWCVPCQPLYFTFKQEIMLLKPKGACSGSLYIHLLSNLDDDDLEGIIYDDEWCVPCQPNLRYLKTYPKNKVKFADLA